ncbi:hypothetical protein FQN49_005033 [Arthroderma sp. PD_2]|nr:hypothetical protein FQN49_005033 [Arthroderma sp. PD_2]
MSARSVRLSKHFKQIVHGGKKIERIGDSVLFLEAICDQGDRLQCVERLVSTSHALEALRRSVCFDVSATFLKSHAVKLLSYLREPSVERLCNGQFLKKIVSTLVEASTFWNSLIEAHNRKALTAEAQTALAWLLLQQLTSPSCSEEVRDFAKEATHERAFLDSPSHDVRSFGYKIEHVLNATSTDIPNDEDYKPGGRHDNDFEDFRRISILPTPDEIASTEIPFYRRANEVYTVEPKYRAAMHHDNQFRLLREDFLAELRNDLQIALGKKRGRRSGILVKRLQFDGIVNGTTLRRKGCSITFRCLDGIPRLSQLPNTGKRARFLRENRNFLKHESFGCLLYENEIVNFATLNRDGSNLEADVPKLALKITGVEPLTRVLIRVKDGQEFTFATVNTAVFAYEHILRRLQQKTEFPFFESLLSEKPSLQTLGRSPEFSQVIEKIKAADGKNVDSILRTLKRISLDDSQLESLLTGLSHSLSLIQGPPGTGKSFIGALLAKTLHDTTNQFLEDLMDIGIPDDSMVRLGSKFTDKTKKLRLAEQDVGNWKGGSSKTYSYNKKDELERLNENILEKLKAFKRKHPGKGEMLDFLEFTNPAYFEAFTLPTNDTGMQRVGKKGKVMNPYYLWDRWESGKSAGVFTPMVKKDHLHIWKMSPEDRITAMGEWKKEIFYEEISELVALIGQFDSVEIESSDEYYHKKNSEIFKRKRIIGCTTTGAAMSANALQATKPGVILVEEAGEILESHILTAMAQDTKQLILIGDHKQLRPKVGNYSLTVEKGEGYDLNMSMFERLVLRGYPHVTLLKQHRMSVEISRLIRNLTYPGLLDADTTLLRPRLRGFQDRVIFVNHERPELEFNLYSDGDGSKKNPFEVEMILQCLRYLGQQGYGTENIVILTPYLGQLYLLQRELAKSNDPVLNDLDSYDLVRAGLVTTASAKLTKRQIRISTIGEESDIVLASLTRSNETGDIGFMASQQRLNVLLSRARNALIMIGNAKTFLESRKGKDTWKPLLDLLNDGGHVYGGFPIHCERHPTQKHIIQNPGDFEKESPDGGCMDPCDKKLKCGVHTCPRRCHQLNDHSKMECENILEKVCPKNHKYSWKCSKGPPKVCHKCEAEARAMEDKKKRDAELEHKRQEIQDEHARKLAIIERKIEDERLRLKELMEQKQHEAIVLQKSTLLQNLKAKVFGAPQNSRPLSPGEPTGLPGNKMQAPESIGSSTALGSQDGSVKIKPSPESAAKEEWEHRKTIDGDENEALDALMDMIGLEDVKDKFLSIKSKVDTVVRQETSLSDERFSAALLGNPGTGKTTVARLYGKFLSSVGVIPGDHFIETSGSRLASEGIQGCKGHLEKLCNKGGGVLFIDEAYQLTSGQNPAGGSVLDFLLAEVENLVGKVVFILAGYRKNMESFFSHNPGIPSRFPIELQFCDYTDAELLKIFLHRLDKKYSGKMEIEGGLNGLYSRIVSQRIGRGRGREGFGNARAVHNEVSRVANRQAKRLQDERRSKQNPDDFLFTMEDMLGPEPSSVLKGNIAWKKLQSLTGLESVKQAIVALFDTIQFNYQRELEEKPLVEYSLNKVFLGNPGTGKTTVAKLYGQILADIGLLSNGEVIVKNPSDFTGNVLGASESITRGILASTEGKVLVIDEAYMLYGGSSTSASGSLGDPYKTAVIDTIVAEVQSVPGDDRCVLLLGYKDQMERMFQNVNPGLSRRFPINSGFIFEDFSENDLQKILNLKLCQIGFHATGEAKGVVRECLRRARNRPHFGNAGEVDILLDKAKLTHQKRLTSKETKLLDVLEAVDFDADFDRVQRAPTNCKKLFEGVVGCDELILQLEGYQRTAAKMTDLDMDPREVIPFNFLFRGPPGTGKTSTARRMGKIYYDMGFLATAEVIECSTTELIGQYVGQTGPKTQALLEKALGKVLFIDEAYRLAEGNFAKEAIDELVDSLTKPRFAQKLIAILAGYDEDINRLMSINPGLTSRFPEAVCFKPLAPAQCLKLFQTILQKNPKIDSSVVHSPSESFAEEISRSFERLARLPAWGNARDIQTLAKKVTSEVLRSKGTVIEVTEAIVISNISSMILERERRQNFDAPSPASSAMLRQSQLLPPTTNPPATLNTGVQTITQTATKEAPPPEIPESSKTHEQHSSGRDPGVPEETWTQLQADRRAAEDREKQLQGLLKEEQETQKLLDEQRDADNKAKEMEDEQNKDSESQKLIEEDRLRRQIALAKYERKIRQIVREKMKEEEVKKKEQEAQKKLREMGVCPAGFQWIKQAGGYRCAGGTHFVTDAQLK